MCMCKLGAKKTCDVIIVEIEGMFSEKHTIASFKQFFGTNCMSGAQSGLQRRIQHMLPWAFCIDYRNHGLALSLVLLPKDYDDVIVIDILLLLIWKSFKYSLVKQAISKNIQELDGLPLVKIQKAWTTRWATHSETSVCIIWHFHSLVTALDTTFTERKDPEARGIWDQFLSPNIAFMIFL